MIRFLHAYFPVRTVFLGLSEAMLAALAFIAATIVWFGTLNASIFLNYENGFGRIVLVVAVLLLCMYYFDLYDSLVMSNRREIFTRLVQVLGCVCIIAGGLYYVFPSMKLGTGVFLTGTVLVGAGFLIWRRLFFLINATPRFAERVLLLGDAPIAASLMRELHERPELGLRVVVQIRQDQCTFQTAAGFSRGTVDAELGRILGAQSVERIIVTMGDRRGKLPVEQLLDLKARGVTVQDGSELYETVTGKISLQDLRLSWLLFSPGFQVSTPLLIYKRVFSMLLSGTAVLITLPVMAIVAIVIKLDSTGPVIFKQKRIGKDGKTFTIFKFRSMRHGVDQEGDFKPAQKDDDRVTRVGRLIRSLRLDELPQLFNILRGDMYFVGPRPFVPNQEEECVKTIPFYRQRWSVKPGATGWAQVNRGYCATTEDNAEKLAYDLFYIKNMSIGLDLWIVFKTFKILLLGRGGR